MQMTHWAQIAFVAALVGALCVPPQAVTQEPAPRVATPPTAGKFICKGREFRIKSAVITAALADPYWCDKYNRGQGKALRWLFTIRSEGGNARFPAPNVDFDGLPIRVTNWHKLAPLAYEWKDAIDPATEEGYATLYIFDHQWVAPGRLEIQSRDGVRFHVIASGKNEEGVEFSLETPAVFREIRVRGSEKDNDETILARLKDQLDVSNLIAAPFKLDRPYDSGIRMGEAIFTPKP